MGVKLAHRLRANCPSRTGRDGKGWSTLFLILAVTVGSPSHAQQAGDAHPPPGFDQQTALATSQRAIGRKLGDYILHDRRGRAVKLADYRGKPLLLSLIYTSCYHICPTTTRHLARVVAVAGEALGEENFTVATIGFDAPRDNPESMRMFAKQQGVNTPGWLFLSADADTIHRLAADLGFLYFPSPKGFDHLIQTTLVDQEGTIYRQVYGTNFVTPQLVEPLKQLLYGRPAKHAPLAYLENRIRLFCTVYDPSSDRYYFDYSLFLGMLIGATSIGLALFFLVREWRRGRRP